MCKTEETQTNNEIEIKSIYLYGQKFQSICLSVLYSLCSERHPLSLKRKNYIYIYIHIYIYIYIYKVCGSRRRLRRSGVRATPPPLHCGDLEEGRPHKIISSKEAIVLERLKLHVVELHNLTTICCNLLVVKLHSYFVLRQVFQLLFGSFFVVELLNLQTTNLANNIIFFII